MKKTSLYLTDDEAEGLRRLALVTGRSQAELIRDGVHRVLDEGEGAGRTFHSLGKGHGGGAPYTSWDDEDLYAKVMGR